MATPSENPLTRTSSLPRAIGANRGRGNAPAFFSPLGDQRAREPAPTVSTGTTTQEPSITVYDALKDVESEWRAFERTADRTPFQSFDWLDKWQRHIGSRRGTRPAIVVGSAADGRSLFILPLAVEKTRIGVRLTWLGSDRCDYNAPLLAPGFADFGLDWIAVWHRAKQSILDNRSLRFDVVDFDKMPAFIGRQPNPLVTLRTTRNANEAHIATLGDDWNSFYQARRSSSSRKSQRKQLNRLADSGPVRFRTCETPQQNTDTLNVLVQQKQRALARMGADDIFDSPGARDFYADVTSDAALSGMVHLSRFDVGMEAGAASVGLIFRNRYYLILSSYNDGDMSRHGPGRAHLIELLRFATEQGTVQFDFTIGNEPYKLDWCDIQVPLFDHLSGQSLTGNLSHLPIAISRLIRRWIRRDPRAWRAYTRMRSRIGVVRRKGSAPDAADGDAAKPT